MKFKINKKGNLLCINKHSMQEYFYYRQMSKSCTIYHNLKHFIGDIRSTPIIVLTTPIALEIEFIDSHYHHHYDYNHLHFYHYHHYKRKIYFPEIFPTVVFLNLLMLIEKKFSISVDFINLLLRTKDRLKDL